MSLAAGIYSYLSDALSVGERVYPLTLPQGVILPAVTYQMVSDDPLLTHDVAQSHPLYDGQVYRETRVQFDAYADDYDGMEALSDELLTAITGYRGAWGSVDVQLVQPIVSLDDYDPATGKWRRISDFYIGWNGGPNSGS